MKLRTCLTLGIMLLLETIAYGNNISITKVRLTDTNIVAKTVIVKFNLSWENSWRDAINWDAAWVFVKYKSKKGKWKHLTMSLTGNAIGGSNIPVKINVPQDKKGAFVYRQGVGNGNTEITDMTFTWNYGTDGLADLDSLETRVFATEMVYVPEGSFAVGDGMSSSRLRAQQNETDYVIISDTLSVPIVRRMGEASPTTTFPIWVDGKKGIDLQGNGVFARSNFPTGYPAFYCMKYELTEGQYADFLNTVSWDPTIVGGGGAALSNNYLSLFPPASDRGQRFTITLKDSVFTASRPDRAFAGRYGYGLNFASWSGLRPMSEFEFEKACRGPLAPVGMENAAGVFSLSGMPSSRYTASGEENGTETISSPAGIYNTFPITIEGGDGGTGPHRVGVFATNSSTRKTSGATFYGIMDMTNNVPELVLTYNEDQYFNGAHGSGYISGVEPILSNGYLTTWGPVSGTTKTTTVSGFGHAGIPFEVGFHGVRYAPAEN